MYYELVVVPLSKYDRYGDPSHNTRRRLEVAVNLVRRYGVPFLVLSGGPKGVDPIFLKQDPGATEASLAYRYLDSTYNLESFASILLDTVSLDTVGNIVIPVQAFAIPLNLKRLLCVTSFYHATRVQQLYDHVCARKVNAAVVPIDYDELKVDEIVRGRHFVDDLCHTSEPGDLNGALAFVADKHPAHHYRGLELEAIAANLLNGTLAGPSAAEVAKRLKTLDISAVRDWQGRWQERQAALQRMRMYDKFTAACTDARGVDQFRKDFRNDIEESEKMLADAGQLLLNGTLDEDSAKAMVHEVPARFWFMRGEKKGRGQFENDHDGWRAFLTIARLSCSFCVERKQTLHLFSENRPEHDQIFSVAELAKVVDVCSALLSEAALR